MAHELEQLREAALREIDSAPDAQALEAARVKYLGRSGSVSAWGERMKTLGQDEKPIVGKLLNEVRTAVTAAIDQRAEKFQSQRETAALANIDVSLPGTPSRRPEASPPHNEPSGNRRKLARIRLDYPAFGGRRSCVATQVSFSISTPS